MKRNSGQKVPEYAGFHLGLLPLLDLDHGAKALGRIAKPGHTWESGGS